MGPWMSWTGSARREHVPVPAIPVTLEELAGVVPALGLEKCAHPRRPPLLPNVSCELLLRGGWEALDGPKTLQYRGFVLVPGGPTLHLTFGGPWPQPHRTMKRGGQAPVRDKRVVTFRGSGSLEDRY